MSTDSGLEGVIAAETVLSDVDGEAGRLVIRGRALGELVGNLSFESLLQLLLAGFLELPATPELAAALGHAREQVFATLSAADLSQLRELPLLDAVRALIARLTDDSEPPTALRLIAAPAVYTAAMLRQRAGRAPIAPDRRLGHAADLLRMLRGEAAAACDAGALDAYLVTVVDHGLNASTFAARVVASTRAGLTSSVIAALSALKGPLHGGAPGPVLDMLDAIAVPEQATAWLEQTLARRERLMGFGHRIYRVRDPRADALRSTLQGLRAARGGDDARLRLAEAVEQAALRLLRREKPQRALETNVEFYTALLLEALGIPREAFTCLFAAGRVGGWIAHAREQALHGRLIRPQSRYVGPIPRRAA